MTFSLPSSIDQNGRHLQNQDLTCANFLEIANRPCDGDLVVNEYICDPKSGRRPRRDCECLDSGNGFTLMCNFCLTCSSQGTICARLAQIFSFDQEGWLLSRSDSVDYVKGLNNLHYTFVDFYDRGQPTQCMGAANGKTCPVCEFRPCAERNDDPQLILECGEGDRVDWCANSYSYANPHNGVFSILNDEWRCFDESVLMETEPPTTPPSPQTDSPSPSLTIPASPRDSSATSPTSSSSSSKSSVNSAVLGGVLGAAVALLLCIVVGMSLYYCCVLKKQKPEEKSLQPSTQQPSTQSHVLTYSHPYGQEYQQPQQYQQPPQPIPPLEPAELPSSLHYKDQGREFASVMAQRIEPVQPVSPGTDW